MKKIYLLIFTAFLSFSLVAQEITIGTDNSTTFSSNQYRSPWVIAYDYSYVQTLYLKSEINTAGYITSISYYYRGTSLDKSNNLIIYMGHTTKVGFDDDGTYNAWIPTTSMTLVYDNILSAPATLPGWVTIKLGIPFLYNNTDNLVIAIADRSPGNNNAERGDNFAMTSMGTPYRTFYYRSDEGDVNGGVPNPNTPSTEEAYVDVSSRMANIKLNMSIALPVSLSNFSAASQSGSNKLSWTTQTEQNNKGFEVQRSIDGTNFGSIGFINSKAKNGSANTSLDYTFTDSKPSAGNNYYRLAQTDMDGKKSLSNVVVVKRNNSRVSMSVIYPNPVNSKLNFVLSTKATEKAMISIINLEGKTVWQSTKNLASGDNKLKGEKAILTERFIKQ